MGPEITDRDMLRFVAGQMGHAGSIASSAITLAVERSHDIDINPAITLAFLKHLTIKNLEMLNEQIAKEMKMSPVMAKAHMTVIEDIINDFIKNKMKMKQVTIG